MKRTLRNPIWIYAHSLAAGLAIVFFCGAAAPDTMNADKAALAPLQNYVGVWKGVGQVRRGSSAGAWIEQADWAWHFADGRAQLTFAAPDDKYFVKGEVSPGEKPGELKLIATQADGKTTTEFTGKVNAEGQLVLQTPHAADGQPARITLRTVADSDRLLMLIERQSGEQFSRLAEVGYTRKDSGFGKGSSGPECVVTGGKGEIQVEYKGQKYFVCCTGCRDLFNDNPEKILAEYKERKAKERAEAEKK